MIAAPLELARPELVDRCAYRPPVVPPGLLRLHSNESPWQPPGTDAFDGLNLYPVRVRELERRMAEVYGVGTDTVLATRGSNDGIDLMTRAFCRAGRDAILASVPTFAMYAEFAAIQGAAVVEVATDPDDRFRVDVGTIAAAWRPGVKLVYLCSPNNPTGSVVASDDLRSLLAELAGRAVVVVDEAYIEFTDSASAAGLLATEPHLAVLRTLSKAHGLAGARVGAVIAQPPLIGLLRSILPPYAVSDPTATLALAALSPRALERTEARGRLVQAERARVAAELCALSSVRRCWRGAGNFVLIEVDDRERFVARCREGGVLVRALADRDGLSNAVRVTIGRREDNDRFLAVASGERASRSVAEG